MAGTFPSRGVWRRPNLRPVDLIVFAAVAYRELFLAAMAGRATRGRSANVLLHAYGRIGRTLAQAQRCDLVARIEAYRRGEVPLDVPVALLAHYAGELPWLAAQTYLAPFPAGLRHAV